MIDRMFIQEEKTTLALDKQLAKEKPGERGGEGRQRWPPFLPLPWNETWGQEEGCTTHHPCGTAQLRPGEEGTFHYPQGGLEIRGAEPGLGGSQQGGCRIQGPCSGGSSRLHLRGLGSC